MKLIYNFYFIALAALLFSSCTEEEVFSFMGEPGINFTSQDYNLGDLPNSWGDPDAPEQMGYTSNFSVHYHKGQFSDKYDTIYVKAKLEGTLSDRPLRVNLAYKPVEGYETPTLVMAKDSVIKAGEYYVRIAVLVERPQEYDKEYKAQIVFDYENSDVVAGSMERQSIVLTASDKYELNYDNMYVDSEEAWNECYSEFLGNYGPTKARFILSVFKDATVRLYMYTNYYPYLPDYGFGGKLDELREALDEYNAKHDQPLQEADGTLITF